MAREPDAGLLGWNPTQKEKKGLLSKERQHRLDTLGFVWDSDEVFWEEQFTALVQFKEKHGHCNVPYNSPENPKLGHWVSTVRHKQRGSVGDTPLLTGDQQRRLEALGFEWRLKQAKQGRAWEKNFKALSQFKAQYAHCNVPRDWPKNPSLAKWVSRQRQVRKRKKLSAERQRQLETLGFVWNIQAPRKAAPHSKKPST